MTEGEHHDLEQSELINLSNQRIKAIADTAQSSLQANLWPLLRIRNAVSLKSLKFLTVVRRAEKSASKPEKAAKGSSSCCL